MSQEEIMAQVGGRVSHVRVDLVFTLLLQMKVLILAGYETTSSMSILCLTGMGGASDQSDTSL